MNKLFYVFIFLPVLIKAQGTKNELLTISEQGIRFEKGLTWQQTLEKAKKENKYIFVDCYATWCVPCKTMEKEIYPLQKVGDLYNPKFICVKMQMDTSNNDDVLTKALYRDANYFNKRYKIKAYPTFLYFNSDGNLLSRSIGATDAEGFIKLTTDVLDPKNDYYKQLENYKAGKRDLVEMSFLARQALILGDTVQSNNISSTYMRFLRKQELLTKDNIEFIGRFTKTSKDVGFSLLYQHIDTINKIMGDDTYAQRLVSNIISNEMISPEIVKAKKSSDVVPDWTAIEHKIRKRYNEYYAERCVIEARANLAGYRKNWPEWSKYFVLNEDKYGTKLNTGHWVAFSLNNNAWAVFKYSNDRKDLNTALSWSGRAVMMDPIPNWMDTYANILYKLGMDKLAIRWEELAAKGAPDDKSIQAMLEKMKNGQPTWQQ